MNAWGKIVFVFLSITLESGTLESGYALASSAKPVPEREVRKLITGETFASKKPPLKTARQRGIAESPAADPYPEWYGWSLPNLRAEAAKMKCDTLFSDSPPAGLPPLETGWHPVCSWIAYHDYRFKEPDQSDSSRLKKQNQWVKGMDTCSRPHVEMKSDPKFVSPSRKSSELRYMTPVEFKDYRAHVEEVRARVADICCAEPESQSKQCRRLMREEVKTNFCTSQAADNEPDDCVGKGTYFTGGSLNGNPVLNLMLTQYMTIYNEHFTDDMTLGHELGHACSFVRRELMRAAGPDASQTDPWSDPHRGSAGCEVKGAALVDYEQLFGSTGATSPVFACLVINAKQAKKAKYAEVLCEGGCPASHLEESFADWMAVLSVSDAKRIPFTVPGFCGGGRDDLHPSHYENLECFLKGGKVQGLLASSLNCLK